MFVTRFAPVLLLMLAACGEKPTEPAFKDEPRGYVEFYMPESAPGQASIGVDTQIFQIENGQRVFKGMTRKWKNLAASKRGLTVTTPPGVQAFVVVYENSEAPVKLNVIENGYHKVRIDMVGMTKQEVIGATSQMRFGLKAVEETP